MVLTLPRFLVCWFSFDRKPTMEVVMAKHLTEMKTEANEAVAFYIDLAKELYNMDFPMPSIRHDVRGTTAGWAKPRTWELNFNPVLLEENFAKMMERTVPHEVAHLIAYKKAGWGYRVKPHGEEWKRVMRDFGCETTRCHKYNTDNASAWRRDANNEPVMAFRQRKGRLPYECTVCHKKLSLGPTQNRRLRNGVKYWSKCCHAPIKPVCEENRIDIPDIVC